MKLSENYAKCPDNPIKLNSVPASILFMNNLVTGKGYHLVYHRKESISGLDNTLIDHYEIMTSENNYDDIFISIYNEESEWIPPEGYLFENMSETMCSELMEFANVDYLDPEDIIEFDDQYIFSEPLPDFDDEKSLIESMVSMPLLERALFNSFGTNLYVENFPNQLLLEYLNEQSIPESKINEIILSITPRWELT